MQFPAGRALGYDATAPDPDGVGGGEGTGRVDDGDEDGMQGRRLETRHSRRWLIVCLVLIRLDKCG